MNNSTKCCEKCYSTWTEKDWPAHTVHDACINQNCPCHHRAIETPASKEDWESEFDEQFPVAYNHRSNTGASKELGRWVKSFISNLLATEKEKLRGKIEGMKKPISKVQSLMAKKGLTGAPMNKEINPMYTYNQAINAILKALSNGEDNQ